MDDLSIFSGNANRSLAADICRHLRIPLGDADVFQFSNENIFVKINENYEAGMFLSSSHLVHLSIVQLWNYDYYRRIEESVSNANYRCNPILCLWPYG